MGRPAASWDPERLVHRQIYIDLIRAYLADYGSQRALASALGLSEAYASYLLEPPRLAGGRRDQHWSVLLAESGHEVADAFRFVKTPSEARARQIAGQLASDAERRAVLLHHVRMARRLSGRPGSPLTVRPISGDAANEQLRAIADAHQAALDSPVEAVTAAGYALVWRQAGDLAASIDARRAPAEFAQAMMFLHDTAQVLGRADLALGFARRAVGALPVPGRGSAEPPAVTRLRVNAMLAEVVTLNTLGLQQDALRSGAHAQTLPGSGDEPQYWLRSFLEQQLTSMAGLPRASLYHAEAMADRALGLVAGHPVHAAGVTRRLADVYLSRGTARSVRKAGRLAEDLRRAISPGAEISPLRRAQILRTLARYHQRAGDGAAVEHLIGECLQVTIAANLIHQRGELVGEFSARSRTSQAAGSSSIIPAAVLEIGMW